MKDGCNNNPGNGRLQSLEGFFLSALDMEEEFAKSVYRDYLDKTNWPGSANKDTLEKIQSFLEILIRNTAKHKSKLCELKKKLVR